MATQIQQLSCLLLFSLTCSFFISSHGTSSSAQDRKVHIVYMGEPSTRDPSGDVPLSARHVSILQKVVGSCHSAIASESLLHSYHRSFNGFVAKLTDDEVKKLAGMEGVVSVFPNQMKKLHTTKSWDFMGFPQNVPRATIESDVIIGMLDTGIWPESESFNDEGFGPPPAKWKGTCQSSSNFTCNNKIIGARYYHSEEKVSAGEIISPRDSEGHGSHTASTAAGRLVTKASLFGLGSGTARGGLPSARIAVYKICWTDGCSDADILAAFDDAIADGVDIISLSVGGSFPQGYFEDSIAIGAFHAMKNGVLTSNSGGNDGPSYASITNVSPWSLSVAASTIDRKFVTQVKLGNGATYEGININTFEPRNANYPIIYAGDAQNVTAGSDSRFCDPGTLDNDLVKGKIVLCASTGDGGNIIATGAVGSIMQEDFGRDAAFSNASPTSIINSTDASQVLKYLRSNGNPTATILKSIEANDNVAPRVVSFSSRGPNAISKDILKPDISAPGVDILAAWSEATTVTGKILDKRVVPYNIISGTSMACPHATAAAAYVKSFNPTWSPAAIKSALMTTATRMIPANEREAELAYGSGHINPVKAVNPGLVYDAGETDYVRFLCGQGYNSTQLGLVTGDSSACSKDINGTAGDLNYPSFGLSSNQLLQPVTRVFHRTVTNVGPASSNYKAKLSTSVSVGLDLQLTPNVLSFQSVGQKQSFTLTVTAKVGRFPISGSLVWDDGVHQVRSPIVAYPEPEPTK